MEDFFLVGNPGYFFLLATLPVGEKERDGDNSQSSCEFNNGCRLKGIGLVKTVPGTAVAVTEEVSLTAVPAKRQNLHWIGEARFLALER